MSTFNIEQIRQTIESIQKTHPAYGFFDVTKITDENAVDVIKNQIDIYLTKATQDTDIYIICEMAKQYINGVRPTIEARPTGEWKITEAYPHKVYCDKCYKTYAQENWEVWKEGSLPRNYCPNCGAKMKGAEE